MVALDDLLKKEGKSRFNTKLVNLSNPTMDEYGKVMIIPFGDVHYGSKFCDKTLLHKTLSWLYKHKEAYILGMGDLLETSTRHSVGAGVYEQDEIVQTQYEHMVDFLKPFSDEGRLLGLLTGNHEERVYKDSGFDLTKTMSRELKTHYLGYGAFIKVTAGKQTYTIYCTHGASGSRMRHTKIKSCIDLQQVAEADIYLMGHVHSLDHATAEVYNVNKKNKTVNTLDRHFIITGSFLDHWGSYGHQQNYQLLKKGVPKLKLHSKERLIRVSI